MQENRIWVMAVVVGGVCVAGPGQLAAAGEEPEATKAASAAEAAKAANAPEAASAASAAEAAHDAKTDYAADLAAFFAEMDRTYPFFDLKDIRRGWAPFKAKLAGKAKTCKSDGEFIGIVLEAVRYLRDGHMGIVKARAEPPAPEAEYYRASPSCRQSGTGSWS